VKNPFLLAAAASAIVAITSDRASAQSTAPPGAQDPTAPAGQAPTPAPPPPGQTPQGPPPPRTPTGPRDPADPAGLGTYDLLGNTGQVTSGTAFNPAISVIPDGVYYNDSLDGGVGELMEEADGFGGAHAHAAEEEGHAHGGVPGPGFSLREAEVAFSGAVDPYFDVWAIFAVADGEIEVEEGYFQTRKLLPGLQLRAGKFFSGFGYVNKQHPHQWDFVDQNLPYDMLLGGSIDDTGVQLTWLPSLPFYAQLGFEALQGDNERFSAQLGSEESPFLDEKAGPRLFTGWLKVSPNVGYSHAVQLGVSYAHSSRHQELVAHAHEGEEEAEEGGEEEHHDEAFQGDAHVFGLDLVWRYDSPRQFGHRDLTLQAEYLRRVKDLSLVGVGEEAAAGERRESTQDGFYAQAVYGFAPRFTLGVRYDVAGLTNRIEAGAETESFDDSRRFSANLTFNPTEFSRLRVQYTRGDVAVGGAREKYDQVYVQFQMSLGAHGAHRF
jgi:hypothetical protein